MTKFFINAATVATLVFLIAACSGGGGGGAALQSHQTPTANVAFVTSVSGNGNLSTWADAGGKTGIAAGDAICQARAAASGFTGTFKAWLSDSTTDAYCHIHDLAGQISANCGQAALPVAAGPWIRTDGHPFSAAIDKLVNPGVVYSPLAYDESGNFLSTWPHSFTGTYGDGTLSAGLACNDWTSAANSDLGMTGDSDSTSNRWTNGQSSMWCDGNYNLICLQTGTGKALTIPQATGKIVFLSSAAYSGNLGGLAGADAKCQARATAAGLANAGNFKAWLSTSAVDARDRLTSNGPWVRIDGIKVADSKAELVDGTLFTSINVTEAGDYVTFIRSWTATNNDGTKRNDGYFGTCDDWTNNTATLPAIAGVIESVQQWSSYGYSICSAATLRIYCFED